MPPLFLPVYRLGNSNILRYFPLNDVNVTKETFALSSYLFQLLIYIKI